MYQDGEAKRRRDFLSDQGHRLFDPVRLCRVVAGHGRRWVILGSPLLPSQPGCAGDRGTVAGVQVVDVVEEGCGPLHIFERAPFLRIGEHVVVARDEAHRDSLARAHTAMVLAVRELEAEGAEVLATEVIAGKAWIDFSGNATTVNLESAIAKDEPLQTISGETGISVWIGKRALETYKAPLVKRTSEIGKVIVERVEPGPACEGTLRVQLAD